MAARCMALPEQLTEDYHIAHCHTCLVYCEHGLVPTARVQNKALGLTMSITVCKIHRSSECQLGQARVRPT